MKIGIIDADLLGRRKHRFPNLVCEKLSGYWKEQGEDVHLLMDYEHLDDYDKVYISKVFTDTEVPEWLMKYVEQNNNRVRVGGTGFYFDKAPNLPEKIEHHMPDYDLYNEWINSECQKASKEAEYEVLVDNVVAKENVSRFVMHQGYQVNVEEQGDDFLLKITK